MLDTKTKISGEKKKKNNNNFQCERSISTRTFFEQLWRRKEKGFSPVNSLHNIKTTRNILNIILWRLLGKAANTKIGKK